MGDIKLSVSILGYEKKLSNRLETIRTIIPYADYLHIDIMRNPFIEKTTAFSEEKINLIYNTFKDDIKFDFHLMVSEPENIIEHLEKIIHEDKRKDTIITIHREAYRNEKEIGNFASKENDLLNTKIHSIKDKDAEYWIFVYDTLRQIKNEGFITGIALEPNLKMNNLDKDLLENVDLILLMGVESGAGNQSYNPDVTEKIIEASKYGKIVQVDGGMNNKEKFSTIEIAIKAGATNIVVGSYITGDINPSLKAEEIHKILNQNTVN